MDITKMIETLPNSVKLDVIDFNDVKMHVNGKKHNGIRVLLDRLLTDDEKEEMKSNKHILGINSIATYRYAPEIKKSYFYVI